jgi:CheY-like chemotaxis protein
MAFVLSIPIETKHLNIMESKKILMVDDDRDFLESQSLMLKHLGYNVVTANGSEEGFEQAKTCNPDLIILDVNMEKKYSGFELHKQIRENKELGQIPIILLTGVVTYSISNQLIDMYREMRGKDDFEINRVLKISDNGSEIAVEYFDEDGKPIYLPLDSFVSKSVVEMKLVDEIKRFLKEA